MYVDIFEPPYTSGALKYYGVLYHKRGPKKTRLYRIRAVVTVYMQQHLKLFIEAVRWRRAEFRFDLIKVGVGDLLGISYCFLDWYCFHPFGDIFGFYCSNFGDVFVEVIRLHHKVISFIILMRSCLWL